MPKNIESGRIYREVIDGVTYGVTDPADVAPIIGCPSGDVGTLCTFADINKWARFKPIRFRIQNGLNWGPCFRPLTDAEFEGDYNDKSNGIYYGIEKYSPDAITSEVSTWPNMHDVEYRRVIPRGLAYNEMFRLSDFASWDVMGRGYNHKAVPNPSGEIWGTIGYYNGTLDGISAGYYETNVEGVDMTRIFVSPSEVLDNVLELTFPCAIVTDENNNTYFTALTYASDGVPRPLRYNNAYLGGFWTVDFTKTLIKANDPGTPAPPWSSAQRFMAITLFMLRVPSSQFIDLGGNPHVIPVSADLDNKRNLGTHWLDCADEGMLPQIVAPPVPFPNGIGKPLSLLQYWVGMRITPDTATFNAGLTEVEISLTKSVDPSGGPYSYAAEVIAEYDGQHLATKTVSGSSTDPSVVPVTFTSLDFEAVYFVSGRTLDITVRTSGSWSSGTNITTKQFIVP